MLDADQTRHRPACEASAADAPREPADTAGPMPSEVAEEAEEVLEGELVALDERPPAPGASRALGRARALGLPSAQAAMVAASGFLAGATAMALAKRLASRRPARGLPAQLPLEGGPLSARPFDRWAPGSTRTYLVSVRLISRSDG